MSTAPQPPTPDGKDWTWVLERPCPECGFEAAGITTADVARRAVVAVDALRAVVTGPGGATRPGPQVWSPLEYGCHVRDVCIVFGARLATMRGTENPWFEDWDQDATALADRYWEQDPARVAGELAVEGGRIAADFASVRDDEQHRPGRRSNGSRFTVLTLGRYFLHDLEHHLHDVSAG